MKKVLLTFLALMLIFCAEAAKKKNKKSDKKDKKSTREKAAAYKIPAGWQTSLSAAQKLAAQQKKPILIVISGPEWCPPCKNLDATVIRNSKFQAASAKKAIRVFLHMPKSGCSAATRAEIKKCSFYRGGVPSYAVVDANLKELATIKSISVQGFLTAIDEAAKKIPRKK